MNKVFLIIAMSFICLMIGFSAADISEANDVINACKHKDEGMVRIVDDHSYCRPSEVPVTWSSTGTAGPEGPEGPEGPQGPEGPPGAGGSLDPSLLYAKECFNEVTCPCDDGDTLISGGVGCGPGDAIYVSYQQVQGGELVDTWQGECIVIDGQNLHLPSKISIRCLSTATEE